MPTPDTAAARQLPRDTARHHARALVAALLAIARTEALLLRDRITAAANRIRQHYHQVLRYSAAPR